MFRIRRVHDAIVLSNKQAIDAARRILAEQLPGVSADDLAELGSKLHDPLSQRLRRLLYVGENARHNVLGFASLLHAPDLRFCFLEYLASAKKVIGRGIGAALYEHVRGEARGLGAVGLFLECLPDDPQGCRDEALRKQNAARLRFYERYGARPIVNTGYETPLDPLQTDNLPHLLYDGLGAPTPLGREVCRKIVKAILERKYAKLCSPAYVQHVVRSIVEDPVQLRAPRYGARPAPKPTPARLPSPVTMVVNDRHDIHHVRDRGYVQAPVRIDTIRQALEGAGLVETVRPREHGMEPIRAVHDAAYLDYLRRVCAAMPEGKSVYPYVFPLRNRARPPRELSVCAGYYCIDTFTPINGNAFRAAKRAVDCTLTAAERLVAGQHVAYSLVRPPGHHAERCAFGGFCYFNNAAIAAEWLSRHGRVAILDLDYHHGNGQQDIFYARADVLTVSIHGSPEFAYPYFSGFAEERGEGPGDGFNLNLPLGERCDGEHYRRALKRALAAIRGFGPDLLVLALGLDTAKGDPTGSWSLERSDFEQNGRLVGQLMRPTLVVQEGGYRTRTLGANALHFLRGLLDGAEGR